MDRWRELAEMNPDILFPEEAINKHDWKEIGNELEKVDNTFDSETMEYIYDGNKNGETVEA